MNEPVQQVQSLLKERLELPRAILVQLRETCLFNPLLDKAIEDIDHLLTKGDPNEA